MSQSSNASAVANDGWPSTQAGWYIVIVLTLAYIVSFIDRMILSLLIEPIRSELGLSDFQMAWVGPPAFAICFLFFGLVFGWMADRVRRTRLVAVGIVIWCIMTAACAFADNAIEMFLARMGVGLGEAVLTPCALSLISDSFRREAVGKPIGFYTMGISMGSSLAFIVGGAAIAWLELAGNDPFAALGVTTPWRETFLLVGIPGLLLVPLMLLMREPQRRDVLPAGGSQSQLGDAWRYLVANWPVFLPLFLGKIVLNIIGYAHFWIIPLFQRTWDISRDRISFQWGIILLGCGMFGVNLAGWWGDRWYRNGRRDAALRVVWMSLMVIVPLHAIAPLMPSANLALLLMVPTLIAAAAASAAGSIATMLVTPNQFRGQMTALSLLIASGAGQFLGPTSVAALTDFVFKDPAALRYSLSIAVLFFSLIGLVGLSIFIKRYASGLTQLEDRLAAQKA